MTSIVSHVIEFNDKSDSVRLLQRALREKVNVKLNVDSHFGIRTKEALIDFQLMNKLTPNGEYKDKTKELLDKYINERFLQDWMYDLVADIVNRNPTEFKTVAKAIAMVESRSEGFFADGSVSILFERHIFHRQLFNSIMDNPKLLDKVAKVVGKTISNNDTFEALKLLSNKYPAICNHLSGGYVGGMAEYKRLNVAKEIHEISAYNSASFGLYQIMGFNAKLCGFEHGLEMYKAMETSEFYHLLAFAKFLESNPVIYKHFKNKDYPAMARVYNGPAYAKNKYDLKLAMAVKKITNTA